MSESTGNGNKVEHSVVEPINLKLAHELWMWRGAVIFLLSVMLVIYAIDSKYRNDDRVYDRQERAEKWAQIIEVARTNQNIIIAAKNAVARSTSENSKEAISHYRAEADNYERLLGILQKTYSATLQVDEHLRQCSGCHTHPNVDMNNPHVRPVN